MLRITSRIQIDEGLLQERFIRASGPGGQNVNKVSSAVELRFDVTASGLPTDIRLRLARLAGRRMTKDGVLVIRAERFRTQERNRADARDRLIKLLRRASVAPKPWIETKPTRAVRERRLKAKAHRGRVKNLRREKPEFD
jgi:ribosome-associated protein